MQEESYKDPYRAKLVIEISNREKLLNNLLINVDKAQNDLQNLEIKLDLKDEQDSENLDKLTKFTNFIELEIKEIVEIQIPRLKKALSDYDRMNGSMSEKFKDQIGNFFTQVDHEKTKAVRLLKDVNVFIRSYNNRDERSISRSKEDRVEDDSTLMKFEELSAKYRKIWENTDSLEEKDMILEKLFDIETRIKEHKRDKVAEKTHFHQGRQSYMKGYLSLMYSIVVFMAGMYLILTKEQSLMDIGKVLVGYGLISTGISITSMFNNK